MNYESRILGTIQGGCYVNMDVIIRIRPAVHAFPLPHLRVCFSNTESRQQHR